MKSRRMSVRSLAEQSAAVAVVSLVLGQLARLLAHGAGGAEAVHQHVVAGLLLQAVLLTDLLAGLASKDAGKARAAEVQQAGAHEAVALQLVHVLAIGDAGAKAAHDQARAHVICAGEQGVAEALQLSSASLCHLGERRWAN
eukprot:CAMPEP_0202857278 /NCGR_PEP_ID=MMETSP1391-20130828/285_1 /ASSEMBLY_ACC=CAM_ASM_000867 /TAXON_ID=1034604 /ORGANISM="Chlamydomonas leiostraca, Strain SAG 11-49" /LENGTH=141 /DNA_ID=CAMNT_0049536063 /DNA_START=140 /DNA_END=565 /DNA_ORIENTATION=+